MLLPQRTRPLQRRLGWLSLALATAASACHHDWGAFDPRDGAGGAGGASSSGSRMYDDGGPPGCAPGETKCADACVNAETDPAHCGRCGLACAPGVSCVAGACRCASGPIDDLGSEFPQSYDGSNLAMPDSYASSCGDNGAGDRLLKFTAPSAGTYLFAVVGASYDTALAVVDAASCNELACHDDPAEWESQTSVALAAGQTILLVVSGSGGAQGNFLLELTQDRSASCAPLDLGSIVPQVVSGSTTGAGDSITLSCGQPGSPDVTYSFTAPRDSTYSFDTFGSNFDTVLEVFDASCAGEPLGCNDDNYRYQSRVLVPLTAGRTVLVAIDGQGGSSGAYELHVSAASTEQCTRTPLGSTVPRSVTGSNVGRPDGLTGTCSPFPGPDVDYVFTAPATGYYRFDTVGSDFDTVLYVRNDSCGGVELACNDDRDVSLLSEVRVHLTQGQTVSVVIDGYFDEGAYTLNVRRE